jgi:hypothetical protein
MDKVTMKIDQLIHNKEFMRLLLRDFKKVISSRDPPYEFPSDEITTEYLKKLVYMTIVQYEMKESE